MGQMVFQHFSRCIGAYMKLGIKTFKVYGILVPRYLDNSQESANFLLMITLMIMIGFEPILHCFNDNHGVLFTDICASSQQFKFFPYSVASMFAMFLYYFQLIDLAVFNNRVSAYVLVCARMVAEVGLFLLALFGVILTFASAFSCLDQKEKEFFGIPAGGMALWEMELQMFSGEHYEKLHNEPSILYGCFVYLVVAFIFLLNMLIAQLSCAYDSVYNDMVGYARLKRIRIIVESMPNVGPKRWKRWTDNLGFDSRIEFNEGDVGLANGIAVLEPANLNPTTVDMIKRFGGSTSPSIQWPEEDIGDTDSDKFERLETLIKRAMERLTKSGGKSKGGKGDSSAGISGSGEGSGEGGGGGSGEGEEEDEGEH